MNVRKPVMIAIPGNEQFAGALAACLPLECGAAMVRHFPDGESYVRVTSPVEGRDTFIVCTLDRPDPKLVPLLLLAAAACEAGAASVGLVAPYLAYMRQDRRFHPGETVSAQHMGTWLSQRFDWVATVDPHLHRITDLSEVFTIPSRVVHAAASVAQWVGNHVRDPLPVGPDEESAQWTRDVAQQLGAPCVVLDKTRYGDFDVRIALPAWNSGAATRRCWWTTSFRPAAPWPRRSSACARLDAPPRSAWRSIRCSHRPRWRICAQPVPERSSVATPSATPPTASRSPGPSRRGSARDGGLRLHPSGKRTGTLPLRIARSNVRGKAAIGPWPCAAHRLALCSAPARHMPWPEVRGHKQAFACSEDPPGANLDVELRTWSSVLQRRGATLLRAPE